MSKRRFASLEDSLERLIEGGFARLFRGSLQPRTVAVQLVRAIEDNLIPADDGRDAAPTLFEIHLCASTHAALMAQAPDVAQQLSRQVVTYCLEADLFLAALPEVTLEPDPTLSAHQVTIQAHHGSHKHETTQIMPPVHLSRMPALPLARLIMDGQRNIILNREVFTIGRHPNNDLVLSDLRVSRHHCQLRVRQGRFVLYDNQSRGGTFVNGQRIVEHDMASGEVIRIGGVSLEFIEESPEQRRKTDTQHDLIPPNLNGEPQP